MTDYETIFALYPDENSASAAVQDLLASGFDQNSINLISNDVEGRYEQYVDADEVDGEDGAGFGAVVGTLTGLAVALLPGVGPIVAAGPFAVALIAGIGAATGAVTGGITASLVNLGTDETDAHTYQEVLRRGGALVIVQTTDDWEDRAEDILEKYNPIDVEEVEGHLKSQGWAGYYDVTAPTYDTDEIYGYRDEFRTSASNYDGTTSRVRRYSSPYPVNRPGMRPFESYIGDFHRDYDEYYSDSGYSYAAVLPAYQHAYYLATAPEYDNYTWNELENDARYTWEETYPEAWNDFKGTVHRAWNSIKDTVTEVVD